MVNLKCLPLSILSHLFLFLRESHGVSGSRDCLNHAFAKAYQQQPQQLITSIAFQHIPMKYIIQIFTALIFLFQGIAQAQEWTLRTPIKNISDLKEIDVTPDGTIYIYDSSNLLNHMYISEDNGATYRRQGNAAAKDMQMIDDDKGFLISTNRLTKTTDKWRTTTNFTLNAYFFENVFFIDENVGFVSGEDGKIHKTIDGGTTWTTLTSGTTRDIYDVFFIDNNIGFACGASLTFLKTIDGGTTWQPVTLPSANQYALNKVFFKDSLNGIVIGVGGLIFNTIDGGTTWNLATTNTIKQLQDVVYINNQYMVVGNDGTLLTSADLGVTWNGQIIDNKDLFSIAASSNTIYIGSENEVFQSFNNGATWSTHLEDVTMSSLDDAAFSDSNTGLMVGKGQNGSGVFRDVMYRTDDGGVNWERKTVTGGYYAVDMKPDGRALTTQFNIGTVSYSSDYGDTWTNIPGPTITQQFIAKAIWLKSRDDFFVGGGNFFASDGLYRYQTGTGWTHNAAVNNVEYIKFLNDNVGVLTNSSNQAYKTIDGGSTWTSIAYTGGNNDQGTIEFIDANTFYIGQQVTTDGGITFQYYNFPGYLWDYRFFSATFAIGVSSNGWVYKTEDGGTTWTVVNNVPGPSNMPTNFYITQDHVYSFGTRTDIYTLEIGALLSNNDTELYNDIKIYPNPTADFINIKTLNLSISATELYDLNGRKVLSQKVDDSDTVDLSSLTTGIYFMHILDENRVVSIHKIIKE
ncbi:MAG: YCF48-related protein [Nonlabens sp.]|uniref:YCF48-related protein n=1 Tax=Nonlabens sp. TaxID=1888209 RepID=UPI003EF8B2D0